MNIIQAINEAQNKKQVFLSTFRLAFDMLRDDKSDDDLNRILETSVSIAINDPKYQDLLLRQMEAVLETLSERECGVTMMRFGMVDQPKASYDEIGLIYEVSGERIRQIEAKTMSKLRHESCSSALRWIYSAQNFNAPDQTLNDLQFNLGPLIEDGSPEMDSFIDSLGYEFFPPHSTLSKTWKTRADG